MIAYVFLATLLIAASSASNDFFIKALEKAKAFSEECQKETNAANDDLAQIAIHEVPTSHEGRCLVLCFQKHMNTLNDDGSINESGLMAFLEPLKASDADLHGKVTNILLSCGKSASGGDGCEKAANIITCAMNESKAAGLDLGF